MKADQALSEERDALYRSISPAQTLDTLDSPNIADNIESPDTPDTPAAKSTTAKSEAEKGQGELSRKEGLRSRVNSANAAETCQACATGA